MKKLAFFFLLCLCISAIGFGQIQTLRVNSQLTEATVFLQGAQLLRNASVNIPAGTSEIIISNLPTNVDPNSVQVKGFGKFMILSVNYRNDYLSDPQSTKAIKELQDSMQYYKRQIDYLNAMLKVYQEEESLILANKVLSGKDSGVQVSELKAAADFMRLRLGEIKKLWLQTNEDVIKNNERHERVRQQLNRMQASQSKYVGEIVVLVSANAPATAKLDISFVYPGAGWHPIYDLRSNSVEEPFDLNLKANVFQNSGEDWNNIKLTLSSGNPYRSAQIQYLSTWRLNFIPDVVVTGRSYQAAPMMAKESMGYAEEEIMDDYAGTLAEVVTVMENLTNISYAINMPVSVTGDNTFRLIEIQNHKVDAKYEYYVVPKLDSDAFLVAKISGWQDYINLPGNTNLFFEGTFVGKSYINPLNTSDTLVVSLGRDKNIQVKRDKKKEYTTRSFLGSRQIENIGWEISVRNNKRQNITLTVMDQIPVSTHKDIDITLDNKSLAKHEAETGFLSWRLNLKPAENKKLEFIYTVKYPKDKRLYLE
ncbi:MAG: DUF4139 domain-containing protein [Bacteroidetes bacterium]|nr:DUF4139 domain-containing protein [Bacteroidota bacterium]